ncbi:unnamed protein product, partial [marine sediment metagenome]
MDDYQYLKIGFRLYPLLYELIVRPHNHLKEDLNFNTQDWDNFLNFISKNKIIPFTYHLINCKDCQKQIPGSVLENLKKQFIFYSFSKEFYKKDKKR